MALTNFPNGVSSFGVPVVPGASTVVTGSVFFVSSDTGANGNPGTSPSQPFATIDYAVGRCTANKGDVIYVMPGHTENVASAGAIDLDVEGISVIGLGSGADRPTLTFSSSTSSDIDVDAANITVENFLFTASVDAVAAAIDVNAADFTIKNCEFRDTSSAQTVIYIDADGNADRLKVEGCKVRQNTAGAASFVRTLGAVADMVVQGNDIVGDYSVANISQSSTASTDVLIQYNNMDNKNAVDVNLDLVATTDGTIRNNTLRIATNDQSTWIDSSDCQLYENYGVNNDDETGKLIGTVST